MSLDNKIILRLDELIEFGERIVKTKRPKRNQLQVEIYLDSALAHQWKTSSLNLLHQVFGADSIYSKNYYEMTAKKLTLSPVEHGIGILRAAKEDYENGHLFNVKKMIEAEVFDEFLEQAEFLLSAGYFQPAAVIAGAVLEDGLRKLCIANSVTLPDNPSLNRMNDDLTKAGQYNNLAKKQITAYADLRNQAAHGEWDSFTSDDVTLMVSGVRNFMVKYF